MALFFFDIADHEVYTDLVGTEYTDGDAARVAAVAFAGNYLRDHTELIWDGRRATVHVRQGDGVVIFSVVMLAIDTPPRSTAQTPLTLVAPDAEPAPAAWAAP